MANYSLLKKFATEIVKISLFTISYMKSLESLFNIFEMYYNQFPKINNTNIIYGAYSMHGIIVTFKVFMH